MGYGLIVKGIHRTYGLPEREYVLTDVDGNILGKPMVSTSGKSVVATYEQAQTIAQQQGLKFIHIREVSELRALPKFEVDLGTLQGAVGSKINLTSLFENSANGRTLLQRVLDKVPTPLTMNISITPYKSPEEGSYADILRGLAWQMMIEKTSGRQETLDEAREIFQLWPNIDVKFLEKARDRLGFNVETENLDKMERDRYAAHPSNVGFYSVNNEILTNNNSIWEFSSQGHFIGNIFSDDVEIKSPREKKHFDKNAPFEHVVEVRFSLHKSIGERTEFLVAQIRRVNV